MKNKNLKLNPTDLNYNNLQKFDKMGKLKNENMQKDNFNINNKGPAKKELLKGFGIMGVVIISILSVLLLIMYIFIINPGFSLFSSAKILKDDLSNISTQLGNRDLVELEKAMQKTEKDLTDLRSIREQKFGWLSQHS